VMDRPLDTPSRGASASTTAADQAGISLKLLVGPGVFLTRKSAQHPPLKRKYATWTMRPLPRAKAGAVLLRRARLRANERFNALRAIAACASGRVLPRQVDIFLDAIKMSTSSTFASASG